MPGYADLNKYIEQNEHTLHKINQTNLKKNIFLNEKLNNYSLHSDGSFSISEELDFCMEKLKQNQLFRSNQLKKINQLFELDINIEDEINLDIYSIQDESRRYDEYDFESYLVGKHHLNNDTQQFNNKLEDIDIHNNTIMEDNCVQDISDVFIKNLDISRINRKNKLKYIAQSLSNLSIGSSDVLNNPFKHNNTNYNDDNNNTIHNNNNNEIYSPNHLLNEKNINPNNDSFYNSDFNKMNKLLQENNIDIIISKNNEIDCINIKHNIFDISMKESPTNEKNFITLESIAENISEW